MIARAFPHKAPKSAPLPEQALRTSELLLLGTALCLLLGAIITAGLVIVS